MITFNCIAVVIFSALTVLCGIEGQIRLREAPYQVVLGGPGGPCGGVILGATWILTAAHCVTFANGQVIPADAFVARAGSNVRTSGGVAIQGKRIIVHDNVAQNDLALLELRSPLPLSSPLQTNIKMIKIRKEDVPTGSAVTAYGWGSSDLTKITATTISQSDCAQRTGVNSAQIICVNRNLTPPCSGDSGGALVFNGQLIGIATAVQGCVAKPDSYVRLSKYAAWVTSHMR